MNISDILEEELKNNVLNYIIGNNFLDDLERHNLKKMADLSLDDEDFENGAVSRYIPTAFLSIIEKNHLTSFVLELMSDSEIKNKLFSKLGIEKEETEKIVSRLKLEILNSGTSSEEKTEVGSFYNTVSLKLFFCENNNIKISFDGNDIDILSGDLIIYKNNSTVKTQIKNNNKDDKLYILTVSFNTDMINPLVIKHKSNSEIGVIIDCKDWESPSQ
jgi:hypothetical protein